MMFSNQHYYRSTAVLLVLLVVSQVCFLLVHHHHETHFDEQETVISFPEDSNSEVEQDCDLCDHFFALSADLHKNESLLLNLISEKAISIYYDPYHNIATLSGSSRAPPFTGLTFLN